MSDRMAMWVANMRAERYDDAWALAAQTLAERDPAKRDDPGLPYHLRWVWDGTPLDGRDVLVRCYHGLGDTIMFARFLPLLAARAASVIVETQPPLVELLARIAPDCSVVPFDVAQPLPPRQVDVEIMELSFALRSAPPPAPYLQVAPAALPPGTIALCHGTGDWDVARSLPAALFAPLCRRAPCLAMMPGPTTLDVLNPQGCSLDIGASAALLAGAQLVITVDTMIAHLAGAIGAPTWLLLKADPDWRWPADRRSSPWYLSMRLYRQPLPGDWEAVLRTVEQDLIAHLEQAAAV